MKINHGFKMSSLERYKVLLINPNKMKPVVAPIALDYLADSLRKKDCRVDLLDLAFSSDQGNLIREYFNGSNPDLIGITIRNTDDCYCASQEFFIPKIKCLIEKLREQTDAPVVLGGCGFSVMPEQIMNYSKADFGIAGEGEEALVLLAERLKSGEDHTDVPGLLYLENGHYIANQTCFMNLEQCDFSSRDDVDNRRYFKEGGQGSIETKRGCDKNCIYCADPLAKGRKIRLRSIKNIVSELNELYKKGIDCIHFCDGEFNNPPYHAVAVCEAMIESGLCDKMKWYAYASPKPFSKELARLMKKAGCIGIDFGVDSGNDAILQFLGRDFFVKDIVDTARICNREGIVFMYDLLLGVPGETRETLKETIELMKKVEPTCVGVSLGVRIYQGTKLASLVKDAGITEDNKNLVGCIGGNQDFFKPIFYLSADLGPDVSSYLSDLVDGDRRFFFANTEQVGQDYNYNENELLVEAIAQGQKGAFWDILRKLD